MFKYVLHIKKWFLLLLLKVGKIRFINNSDRKVDKSTISWGGGLLKLVRGNDVTLVINSLDQTLINHLLLELKLILSFYYDVNDINFLNTTIRCSHKNLKTNIVLSFNNGTENKLIWEVLKNVDIFVFGIPFIYQYTFFNDSNQDFLIPVKNYNNWININYFESLIFLMLGVTKFYLLFSYTYTFILLMYSFILLFIWNFFQKKIVVCLLKINLVLLLLCVFFSVNFWILLIVLEAYLYIFKIPELKKSLVHKLLKKIFIKGVAYFYEKSPDLIYKSIWKYSIFHIRLSFNLYNFFLFLTLIPYLMAGLLRETLIILVTNIKDF